MYKALWLFVSSVAPNWQRLLASSTGFAGQPAQTIVKPPQGSAVVSAQPTVEAKASGRKELPAVCDLPLWFYLGCIMLMTFIMSTKCYAGSFRCTLSNNTCSSADLATRCTWWHGLWHAISCYICMILALCMLFKIQLFTC